MLKNISAGKKLLILFIVILLIFAGINGFWLFAKKIPYDRYMDKMEDGTNERVEDGYSYVVQRLPYLGYGGFLAVSKEGGIERSYDEEQEEQEIDVTLYIWPGLFGKCEYGVMMNDGLDDGMFEQVMIDKNLNHIPYGKDEDYNKDKQELVEEYHDEISELMERADKMWDIR